MTRARGIPRRLWIRLACVSGIVLSVLLLRACAEVGRTLAIIKPDAIDEADKIKIELTKEGFTIIKNVRLVLARDAVAQFYEEHREKTFFPELINSMGGRSMIVMVLERENAVKHFRELIGPTDPAKARETHPDSLRARFGRTKTANAVHGSDSEAAADREIFYFFPSLVSVSNSFGGEL